MPIWRRWTKAAQGEGSLTWYIAQIDTEDRRTDGPRVQPPNIPVSKWR